MKGRVTCGTILLVASQGFEQQLSVLGVGVSVGVCAVYWSEPQGRRHLQVGGCVCIGKEHSVVGRGKME